MWTIFVHMTKNNTMKVSVAKSKQSFWFFKIYLNNEQYVSKKITKLFIFLEVVGAKIEITVVQFFCVLGVTVLCYLSLLRCGFLCKYIILLIAELPILIKISMFYSTLNKIWLLFYLFSHILIEIHIFKNYPNKYFFCKYFIFSYVSG